jgi:hypothetical protein
MCQREKWRAVLVEKTRGNVPKFRKLGCYAFMEFSILREKKATKSQSMLNESL